eukprot:366054-Chlamydomonas_euryale.AAC.7
MNLDEGLQALMQQHGGHGLAFARAELERRVQVRRGGRQRRWGGEVCWSMQLLHARSLSEGCRCAAAGASAGGGEVCWLMQLLHARSLSEGC